MAALACDRTAPTKLQLRQARLSLEAVRRQHTLGGAIGTGNRSAFHFKSQNIPHQFAMALALVPTFPTCPTVIDSRWIILRGSRAVGNQGTQCHCGCVRLLRSSFQLRRSPVLQILEASSTIKGSIAIAFQFTLLARHVLLFRDSNNSSCCCCCCCGCLSFPSFTRHSSRRRSSTHSSSMSSISIIHRRRRGPLIEYGAKRGDHKRCTNVHVAMAQIDEQRVFGENVQFCRPPVLVVADLVAGENDGNNANAHTHSHFKLTSREGIRSICFV
mmetsp:Transcript_841/g.1295  ORF Transcript_841/g.1295 Transcript_841/m.1295 type:complete len:272 (-) Transcript_841:1753-2568(-)